MSAPDSDAARFQRLKRENERLRRSVHELSLLNDLARDIGASRDVEAVIHTIVRRALKSVEAEQGILMLVEESEGSPMKTLMRTAGSSVEQGPYTVDNSLLGWMMLHKKPLVVNAPRQDERFRGTHWDASIRSILCVPMLIRSRLTGLLTVYNKKTPTGFTDGDQRLLSIIAAQSAQIVENARLYEEEQKLVHIREEMRLALEIQTSLLPKEPPRVPGYDIAGISLPAQTVGGDYFDYIALDDGLGLCVGDVSGKGLPASLLMANVQATLRGQAPWSDTVSACLGRVNTLLCSRMRKGSFVTLIYGLLDPHRHAFRFANAGHNRPYLRQAADAAIRRLDLGGLALGFLAEHTYQQSTVMLAPGDVLLLYSDGIPEAMNPAHEQFGDERLVALLKTHGNGPAQTLIDRILEAVRHHVGEAPPNDDMTLLALRRVGGLSDDPSG